jgi:hypothetical protein
MSEKKIVLTPSQRRMVLSDATVVVLIGPKGEGKTYAALPAIFYHCKKFSEPVRGAIVRDRFTNIQRHTIPSIMKAVGSLVTFHRDGALMKGPNFEADLFGVDDLGDVQNIHGSEYMWVWIEEPAPVFEVGSAGIREEVFDMIYARGGRSEGAIDKVFVTMNPASKAHWTWKRFVLHPEADFEIIRIPYGENPHLPPKEREKTKRAFKNRPDLYQRYVKGEFASVSLGQAVTPEFSEIKHRSLFPLIPQEIPSFRFWDGGLFPTCVFVQIHPNGQIVVYKSLRGNDIGMHQHITLNVKPYMAMSAFHKVHEWRDIGDPSLFNRDPMDSNLNVAQIIEEELDTTFELGEMSWENRKEVLKEVLTRDVDGQPRFIVNSDDDVMIEALGGGWHYHKNSSGQVLTEKPMKDIHSHPGDALSHGLAAILMPQSNRKPQVIKANMDFNIFDDGQPQRNLQNPQTHQKEDDWSPYSY